MFEQLSGVSVLIVLSRSGGISGHIGQCPLQLCQGYYILKQNGLSFMLSRQNFPIRFSSKAMLSKKITLFNDEFCFADSALLLKIQLNVEKFYK